MDAERAISSGANLHQVVVLRSTKPVKGIGNGIVRHLKRLRHDVTEDAGTGLTNGNRDREARVVETAREPGLNRKQLALPVGYMTGVVHPQKGLQEPMHIKYEWIAGPAPAWYLAGPLEQDVDLGVTGSIAILNTTEANASLKSESLSCRSGTVGKRREPDTVSRGNVCDHVRMDGRKVLFEEVGENSAVDQDGQALYGSFSPSAQRNNGVHFSQVGRADILHDTPPVVKGCPLYRVFFGNKQESERYIRL